MAAGEDMEVDSPAVDIVDVEKDAKRFEICIIQTMILRFIFDCFYQITICNFAKCFTFYFCNVYFSK